MLEEHLLNAFTRHPEFRHGANDTPLFALDHCELGSNPHARRYRKTEVLLHFSGNPTQYKRAPLLE
jgi:hypothetical protein